MGIVKNSIQITLSCIALLLSAIEQNNQNELVGVLEAIQNAQDGDVIEIPRGTYNVQGISLTVAWKTIHIKAKPPAGPHNVIFDLGNSGPFLTLFQGNSTIEGIQFRNAHGPDWGGAIWMGVSDGTVKNCWFDNNRAEWGGGAIYAWKSDPEIINCRFKNNSTGYDGAGLYFYKSNPTVKSSLFVGNAANGYGGAIFSSYHSVPTIQNCTMAYNTAQAMAGGIWLTHPSSFVDSSLLWGNWPDQINESLAQYNFCNIEETKPPIGMGNMSEYPEFIDSHFHIGWNSPCRDTGNPLYMPAPDETDLDGLPRIMGPVVDIGSYEVVN